MFAYFEMVYELFVASLREISMKSLSPDGDSRGLDPNQTKKYQWYLIISQGYQAMT